MVDLIRRLCKEQGKTLFSLEKECGFGNGTINKWDKNSPSVDKVVAVASALDVPVVELLDGFSDKKSPPSTEDGLSASETEIIRHVRALTPDQVDFLLAWLKTSAAEGQ